MDNPWVIVVVTTLIIAASAFFVAVEFALIAAKRHRLEDAATESRSARAALRSASELTVLLAGSQLGITVCALALGAITKPAVHYALRPVIEGWGAPYWVADVVGFALALVVVTFLHLVVGEMAPKSWAIAHPERSATMLALPMRGFMWFTRPLLLALNNAANWCLRRVGVEPVDEVATGQNPDDLRQLLEHSANVGALDARFSQQLSGALDLARTRVGELVSGRLPIAVPEAGTVADVQEVSRTSGHLRILVGPVERPTGLVHVRDTLDLEESATFEGVVRECHRLDPDTSVLDALSQMRAASVQLALVPREDGTDGVVTIADMLRELFTPAVQDGQAVPPPG